MSSWIPSLFNPNRSRDPDSDYDNPTSPTSSSPSRTPRSAASGVKDDLSAAFRGVAAFLTPREFQGQLDDDDDDDDDDKVKEDEEDEDENAMGITEEVVDFVRKLSTRQELWIDFPVSLADG